MIKIIENLTDFELNVISKIWLQSNLDTHDFIPSEYWIKNYNSVREGLSNTIIYTYSYEDEIVGFLGLVDDYIAGIFVLKAFRSLGVGTKLLNEAKSKNNRLTLSVFKKNKQAIYFYQMNDFKTLQERLDNETNELEYLMNWNQ